MTASSTDDRTAPPLAMALTPLVVAIASISLMIYMFQGESLGGPVQLALIFSAALAAGLLWPVASDSRRSRPAFSKASTCP